MFSEPLCRKKRLATAGGWLVLVVALTQLIALPLGALAWLHALDYESCGARLVAPPAALMLGSRAGHKRASIHWQQQRGRKRTIGDDYDEDDADYGADNRSYRGERLAIGYEAYAGEFPWFVQLTSKFNRAGLQGSCGGVIIHANLILTAAHCLKLTSRELASEVLVEAGARQTVRGQRWLVDKNYDGLKQDYKFAGHDLGLIKLDRPLQYDDYVQPACLPGQSGAPATTEAGCTLAGMGFTDGNRKSDRLLAMPLERCPRDFPARPGESCYISHDRNFPGGACSGDSGSALMCPNDWYLGDQARFFAVGLTSSGPAGDCRAGDYTHIYFTDTRQQMEALFELVRDLSYTSRNNKRG